MIAKIYIINEGFFLTNFSLLCFQIEKKSQVSQWKGGGYGGTLVPPGKDFYALAKDCSNWVAS